MTQRLNPNIAEALDMELPDNPPVEDSAPLVVVEPHEIVRVDNPDLPDMSDIEVKNLEGEKQLETLIGQGMGMTQELYAELPEIEPKYRNRHLEITAMIMSETRGAIETKLAHQLKRKEQRLKEAGFGAQKDGGKVTQNFFGSREDIMKLINGGGSSESDSQ